MTELENFFAKEIIKSGLQTEYLDDGSHALMQIDYQRCAFCGSDNLDSAKNDKALKPVEHDENCAFVRASKLLAK